MTKDDQAKDRRDRAQARMDSATHIRKSGSFMMIAGGVLLGMATVAFASHNTPEIPSWIRQTILSLIGMLWLGGMAFYVGGQSLQRMLNQMADDRAERESQHEEEMTLLREIKRNQTFLLARPGAGGEAVANEFRYSVRASEDTLDMLRRQRRAERQQEEQPADPVDPRYLADMSEAVRLGEELAKRKLKPPDQAN